jgi:NAD(P)-dependent dehydrogenase (short-subunit alcohol dehydrogenase family)
MGRAELLGAIDLTDGNTAGAMVAQARERLGRLDVVIYAAGLIYAASPYIPLVWINELHPKETRSTLEHEIARVV